MTLFNKQLLIRLNEIWFYSGDPEFVSEKMAIANALRPLRANNLRDLLNYIDNLELPAFSQFKGKPYLEYSEGVLCVLIDKPKSSVGYYLLGDVVEV